MISASLNIRVKDFWFFLFPICVFIIGDVFFDIFSNWKITVSPGNNPTRVIDETTARYAFLTSQFAFMILSLSVFIYFIYDINRSFSYASRKILIYFYITLCLMMITLIWKPQCQVFTSIFASVCQLLPEHTYYLLDKQFFTDTLTAIKLSGLPSYTMFDVYTAVLKAMNFGAFLAVPALIVGSVSSLGRNRPVYTTDRSGLAGQNSKKDEISDSYEYDHILTLGYQADRLKTYLFLSSVLLIGVVIQMNYWMELPSFALDKDTRKNYDGLFRSITSYYGLNYTILLCSYYIPPCIVISRRMHNAAKNHLVEAKEPLTVKSIRQWESKMGIQVIDFKSYKIIAALLSPLLPGLFGSVMGVFGGAK